MTSTRYDSDNEHILFTKDVEVTERFTISDLQRRIAECDSELARIQLVKAEFQTKLNAAQALVK